MSQRDLSPRWTIALLSDSPSAGRDEPDSMARFHAAAFRAADPEGSLSFVTVRCLPDLPNLPDETVVVLCGEDGRHKLQQAIQALDAGFRVVVAEPVAVDHNDLARLSALPPEARERLWLHGPRRWDVDVLAALELKREGFLGALLAIRHFAWAPRMVRDATETVLLPDRLRFQTQVSEHAGPALAILGESPDRVSVTGVFDSWILHADFPGGANLWMELRRGAVAPLVTGWIIDGSLGGYRQGKSYRTAPDGETIDIPVPSRARRSWHEAFLTHFRGAPTPAGGETTLTPITLHDLAVLADFQRHLDEAIGRSF